MYIASFSLIVLRSLKLLGIPLAAPQTRSPDKSSSLRKMVDESVSGEAQAITGQQEQQNIVSAPAPCPSSFATRGPIQYYSLSFDRCKNTFSFSNGFIELFLKLMLQNFLFSSSFVEFNCNSKSISNTRRFWNRAPQATSSSRFFARLDLERACGSSAVCN